MDEDETFLESLTDEQQALAKRRIAAWERKHPAPYDSRSFYNRSEAFQRVYLEEGRESLLHTHTMLRAERDAYEASKMEQFRRRVQRTPEYQAYAWQQTLGHIHQAIQEGVPFRRDAILELPDGQELLDAGTVTLIDESETREGETICVYDICDAVKGNFWAEYWPVEKKTRFGGRWWRVPDLRSEHAPTDDELGEWTERFTAGFPETSDYGKDWNE